MADPEKRNILICHSRTDRTWHQLLVQVLGSIVSESQIHSLVVDDKGRGEDRQSIWEEKIKEADSIILFMSKAFLESDFISEDKYLNLLKLRAWPALRIVVVISEDCDWRRYDFISRQKIIPGDGIPLDSMDINEAFAKLYKIEWELRDTSATKFGPITDPQGYASYEDDLTKYVEPLTEEGSTKKKSTKLSKGKFSDKNSSTRHKSKAEPLEETFIEEKDAGGEAESPDMADLDDLVDSEGFLDPKDIINSEELMGELASSPPPPEEEEVEAAEPPDPEVPGNVIDTVHFTVTSPVEVLSGSSFILDVWAHLGGQRDEVIERAREAYLEEEFRTRTAGPGRIARGTVLTVHLKIAGMAVDEPEQTILWEGEIGSANYLVEVPKNAPRRIHAGMVMIYARGIRVARIAFRIAVVDEVKVAEPVVTDGECIKKAFASYASADRDKVVHAIQGLKKGIPDLDIFLDIDSLRSGEKWEKRLFEVVPNQDVFYLFWSKAASESKWVEKEWRCAFDKRGIDYIDPLPLIPPDEAPPPEELSPLHFNDRYLAYIKNG